MVDTFGTGEAPDETLQRAVREVFDLKPQSIIQALQLRNPIYQQTAAYGHFGRTPRDLEVSGRRARLFTWEDPTCAADLRDAVRSAA